MTAHKSAAAEQSTWPTSNEEFLLGLFPEIVDECSPATVSFHGAPKDQKIWLCQPWPSKNDRISDHRANQFFTLARFARQERKFRRSGSTSRLVDGVLLDDLGTKAHPVEALKLPPTYVIETSPGNFQAGYLFDEPSEHINTARALHDALAATGFTDHGANSPETRLGRLPFGANWKYPHKPSTRLVQWNPDNRYSIDQLCEAFELRLESSSQHSAGKGSSTPTAAGLPVVDALKALGLYKRSLPGLRHDITCPWVEEHTDAIDDGACYFEPDDFHPIGGFKCHHSHGEHKKIIDLLEFLKIDEADAGIKPVIMMRPGAIDTMVNEAECALAGHYFQRGGDICEIVFVPDAGTHQIKSVRGGGLLRALARSARWLHSNKQGNTIANPSNQVLRVLSDQNTFKHLPALVGLARQPFLRPDHTLCLSPGYDLASRMYGTFAEEQFHVCPTPSEEDARQCLDELLALLSDFPFAEDSDRSAALAAILTAASRPTFSQAPMFHIRAPQYASGKSYLCTLIALFAAENPPGPIAMPMREEEFDKQLLALLMASPGVVIYDNLTRDIPLYKLLCSALTDSSITGRVLGESKSITVSTKSLFLSSGNNVGPIGDMTRRCLTIMLDPNVDCAISRSFKSAPVDMVRAARSKYISDALTVLCWASNQNGGQLSLPAIASYDQWSSLVRRALVMLGQPDPALRIYRQVEHDPEREQLARLIHLWQELFADKPIGVRELLDTSQFAEEPTTRASLTELLHEIAGDGHGISRRRLGWWIKRHERIPVDGARLEPIEAKLNAKQWRLRRAQVAGLPDQQSLDD